jgi:glycosyltransferase involved in cell wall biosynthesis
VEQAKTVVVHRGARDGYQVARALAERGLLEALVTDLYWPSDHPWAHQVETALSGRLSHALLQRWSDPATSQRVSMCWASGLYSLGMSKLRRAPFDWQRRAIRWCDTCLGKHAGKVANRRDAALLSYSYYGQSAFSEYSGRRPRILFQLHPHPTRVREILVRERELHPECADSLNKEWELALPRQDYDQLTAETHMAEHWIAASSFTRETLIDSGVPPERIHVVPYGANLERFRPGAERREYPGGTRRRLRLLFVGTINQRKGIKYLLEALKALPSDRVELVVCGRVVDDLKLFEGFQGQVDVRPSVSADALLDAYQTSDLFVFPSLAEGFGHVLLEAMACGLPVVSTTRTAARDLVRPGVEGFVVEPGSSTAIAACIEEFLSHPEWLTDMGVAARRRAEEFTWARFRAGIGDVVGGILGSSQTELAHSYV